MLSRLSTILQYALLASIACGLCSFAADSVAPATTPDDRPNVIIILADDLGYNDLGCFGSKKIKTPHLDEMAAAGMKLTSFYASAPICTPSRASLMTGRYPSRLGLGTPLHTPDTHGLAATEVTIAELLTSRGYATACIGKWHLGHQPEFYPTRHGFDYYYGAPLGHCFATERMRQRDKYSDLFLRNQTQVAMPPFEDQTKDLTEDAVRWLRQRHQQPFFLFLSHVMPHGPVAASAQFRGRSAGGPYGDAVEEIDWSTGQLLQTLQELDLTERTIVVFTSDNGACKSNWEVDVDWVGSNAPYRGLKQQCWEGGLRVPCVVWAPGRVPAGTTCDELTTMMDFLPTFATMAGATVPTDRVIDGHDVGPLLRGDKNARSPYDAFVYHARFGKRAGIRMGQWKLLTPVDARTWRQKHLALYNLQSDPGEQHNLAGKKPEIVQRLLARLNDFEQNLATEAASERGK